MLISAISVTDKKEIKPGEQESAEPYFENPLDLANHLNVPIIKN